MSCGKKKILRGEDQTDRQRQRVFVAERRTRVEQGSQNPRDPDRKRGDERQGRRPRGSERPLTDGESGLGAPSVSRESGGRNPNGRVHRGRGRCPDRGSGPRTGVGGPGASSDKDLRLPGDAEGPDPPHPYPTRSEDSRVVVVSSTVTTLIVDSHTRVTSPRSGPGVPKRRRSVPCRTRVCQGTDPPSPGPRDSSCPRIHPGIGIRQRTGDWR